MSLRELARGLSLDVWAAHDVLRANGVAVAQGAREDTRADLLAALAELRA